jgi:LacI family transcriptional regulator
VVPTAFSKFGTAHRGAQFAISQLGESGHLTTITTQRLDAESGVRSAEELVAISARERPTAVLAANDLLAIGLLQGFVTSGVRVPEQMSLIGYDDIAFAAAAAVPLSSVRQPRYALGVRAAELLFAEIEALDNDAAHEHRQIQFVPDLVVRRSTAQPANRVVVS